MSIGSREQAYVNLVEQHHVAFSNVSLLIAASTSKFTQGIPHRACRPSMRQTCRGPRPHPKPYPTRLRRPDATRHVCEISCRPGIETPWYSECGQCRRRRGEVDMISPTEIHVLPQIGKSNIRQLNKQDCLDAVVCTGLLSTWLCLSLPLQCILFSLLRNSDASPSQS